MSDWILIPIKRMAAGICLKPLIRPTSRYGTFWEGLLCRMRNFWKVYFAEFSLRNVPQITP